MADLDITTETSQNVQIEAGLNDHVAQQFSTEVISQGPEEIHTEEVKHQQILSETNTLTEGATASEHDFYSRVRTLMDSCEAALKEFPSSEQKESFSDQWCSQALLLVLKSHHGSNSNKIEILLKTLDQLAGETSTSELTDQQKNEQALGEHINQTSQLTHLVTSLLLKIHNQQQSNHKELEEINILKKVQEEMQSKFVEDFMAKHNALMKQFGGQQTPQRSKTYDQQLAQQVKISKTLFSNDLLDEKERNVVKRAEIKNFFGGRLMDQIKIINRNYEKFENEDLGLCLLESLPESEGKQWPKRADLVNLTLHQLQEFRVTKLAYYDHKKRHDENWQWRVSFRFESNQEMTSPILGYDQWQKDPSGQEEYVKYVDLENVSKIVVMSSCGHQYSTCALLFYAGSDLQNVVASKAWGFNEENMLSYLNNEGTFKHKTFHIGEDRQLVGFRFCERTDGNLQHYYDFEPVLWSVFDFIDKKQAIE